jgi:hypothetical protein
MHENDVKTGSEPAREQISAWLDDELPAVESTWLAARLSASPGDRAQLARFALIGAALRESQAQDRLLAWQASGIATRVAAELAGEGGGHPAAREFNSWRPVAIAAGLGLAAVLLVPMLRDAAPAPDPLTAGVASAPSARLFRDAGARGLILPAASSGGESSLSPDRLTNYLVYHGEYSRGLSLKVADSHIVNVPGYRLAVAGP